MPRLVCGLGRLFRRRALLADQRAELHILSTCIITLSSHTHCLSQTASLEALPGLNGDWLGLAKDISQLAVFTVASCRLLFPHLACAASAASFRRCVCLSSLSLRLVLLFPGLWRFPVLRLSSTRVSGSFFPAVESSTAREGGSEHPGLRKSAGPATWTAMRSLLLALFLSSLLSLSFVSLVFRLCRSMPLAACPCLHELWLGRVYCT